MKEYQMPPAHVGLTVLYYSAAGSAPSPAMVTEGNQRTLRLAVVYPDAMGFMSLDGVRHRSDPDKHAIESSGYGVWDYVPLDPRLIQTVEILGLRIAALEAKVADLDAYQRAQVADLDAYDRAHQEAKAKIAALEAKVADLEVLMAPPVGKPQHKKG